MSYVANLFPPITTLIIIWYTMNTIGMSLAESYFLASITSLLFYPGKTVVTGLDTWNSVTIALGRIDKFLSVEEKKVNVKSEEVELGTLSLTDLTASWINQSTAKTYNYKGDTNSVSIKNIDFNFEPGKLYAIVGNVGSGKSSLLYSALGELEIKTGSIRINGSLAYVPQSVFLINDTIKNNILFGKDYDEERYINSVVKSGFFADLKNLAS